MADQLYAGFAKRVTNPPMGINIPGYFKKRISDGVITDLYLQATAFQCGDKKAIVMTTDAVAMIEASYKIIRDMIVERTGIDPNSIYICCMHSHTSFGCK